jgi:hypothetical protein
MASLDHFQSFFYGHWHRFPFRPAVDVGVPFKVILPLRRRLHIQTDGFHRTHQGALLTGDADLWVDAVLILFRGGADAIDGTYLDA